MIYHGGKHICSGERCTVITAVSQYLFTEEIQSLATAAFLGTLKCYFRETMERCLLRIELLEISIFLDKSGRGK